MTETTPRKPFYLRPPINILFDINRLEKLTPWSVNIAFLLRHFLSEMERLGRLISALQAWLWIPPR